MSRKGQKKAIRESGFPRSQGSPEALGEAAVFLQKIERWRRLFKGDLTPLNPLQEKLVEQIELAFAGVSCHHESRVMLCGEAADEYMSAEAEAVLATREERDDWHAIPDDMVCACSTALCFVGPEAYRFLIPRYMIAAMHEVVEVYPGLSAGSELEDYIRRKKSLLNEAQQQCLSDFLNVQQVDAETGEYHGRSQFLPWELDEYRAHFADKLTPREYGALLVQRYAERMGLSCRGSV